VSSSQLAALLVEHAAALQGAETVAVEEGLELRLDGERFAVLGADLVDLRLRPEVASAALRTPDASSSPRGPGWVRFEPSVLDGFARDRAIAWLESAWRFAGGVADEGGAVDEGRPRALQAP